MDLKTTVKTEMWKMLHDGKGDVCEFADSVGKSSNYIYRISSPTEEMNTPLEIVVKMMQFKKNYSLLTKIAAHCGFMLVRIPKVPAKKGEENAMVSDYEEVLSKGSSAVVKFFNKPTMASYEAVADALRTVISESAAMSKTVDKKQTGQMEINF